MVKYEFDSVVNQKVKITPMNLLFPKEIIDELRELDIKEGWCYINAVKVAKRLQEKGYEVDVVEGYYACNQRARQRYAKVYTFFDGWMEHRWCKIGEYYFDPTHFLDKNSIFSSNCFDYKAERLYYADDLLNFAEQVGKDYISALPFFRNRNTIWCSSLTGATSLDNGRTVVYLAKVDDDFNYVKVAS